MNGKHKFLEDQLLEGGYDVACFQETKTGGGLFSSTSFHRFASEHETHWGVAVWVRRFLTVDGNLVPIRIADCRVLICGPRLIAVKVTCGSFRLVCISAHLPHQAYGAQCRQDIFSSIASVLERASQPTLAVLGIDANARLPCGFADVSGHIEHGEPDEFGFRFAEKLSELGLWAPATFAEFHTGETATWRHAHGRTSRIDFVCLGRELPHSDLASWVALDFDLLTTNDDHSAVAVSGSFWLQSRGGHPGRLWRRQYNLPKLSSPEGREALRRSLEAVGSIPWSTEVNVHAAILERVSHDILNRHFALKHGGPRSSYISDEVWNLRERRNRLKSRTRFWKEGRATALLKVGLAGLGGRTCALPWRKISILYDLFAAAIRFSTGHIKARIREDKQSLLHNIVGDNAGGSLQQIQKAIPVRESSLGGVLG